MTRSCISPRRFAGALLPALLLALAPVASALALSTDRAANLFSGDEDIVLNTSVSGTANWTLRNDYGETISGSSPVVDGKVRISTFGLRYGQYVFAVEGDGQIIGGIVPPLVNTPPDLSPVIFAPFRLHWNHPEEALMYRQIGMWELRYEFRFDSTNPERGVFKFDPAIDRYMQALADNGIRPSFKINGPPRWNDTSTVRGKWGEPRSYPDFEETLWVFAKHYLRYGMDRYYIINEPDQGGWWSAGWDGYYRFLASCARTLRSVDSRMLIIAPESWSYVPAFVSTVINSGDADIISGHYPVDNSVGNVHGAFYYTEMRKAGKPLPFINTEEFAYWPSNLNMTAQTLNYPGIVPGTSIAGIGPNLLMTLETGGYRVVYLHLLGSSNPVPYPFAVYQPGRVLPSSFCFQNRAANDALAGAQFRRRLMDAPPNLMAWLFKRGSDQFLAAFVPVGQMTQMIEISTTASSLRVVDCFGNESTAQPVNGKVRVLVTNAEVYVHGMGPGDTVAYVPHLVNEPPQIADPGRPVAAVGVPFRMKLDGYDADANYTYPVILREALSIAATQPATYGGYNSQPTAAQAARRPPQWSLVKSPEGMSIRPGSGVLEWTPSREGPAEVVVRLTDADGAVAERAFVVQVQAEGSNLPPVIVSRPSPVAVPGVAFTYTPKATDPNGDAVSFSVQGPAEMALSDGVIRWTPRSVGVFPIAVIASDGKGGRAVQNFELVVQANPDRPAEGLVLPRMPTDLTVVASEPNRVTLVWNTHGFYTTVIQRATSPTGPWRDVGTAELTSFTDAPPAGPVYYRAIARNAGGDSEPTAAVNGRNRLPIADAGPSVKLAEPGEAQLDGSQSKDPEGASVTYRWSLVAAPPGSKASISEAATARARLNADVPGRYVVSLVVNDGQDDSVPDYAWVGVGLSSQERVSYARVEPFAFVGQRVEMMGYGSPASRGSRWFWRWDGLPLYAYSRIRNDQQQTASFTPPLPGVYHPMLFARDENRFGYPRTARVIVAPAP